MNNSSNAGASLLCSVGPSLYAIPLEHVVETMRPLPVERLAGAPDFVSGVAIVRGAPLPVIEASRLLEQKSESEARRFVTVRAGDRCVVLAVDGVLGIRNLPQESRSGLPPLLRGAGAGVIGSLGALDSRLLMVLNAVHLVPESLAHALLAREAR